ncbi:MAG: hypothetical protein ACXWM8_03400 [Candidatus Limnocylindrales bacterium]
MKLPSSIVVAAALCLAPVGCSGQTPSLLPSPTPALSPSPSVSCTASSVLAQVDQLLAGQDFEAHYLTIGDKFTLSVWLVDPEIDPETPLTSIATADRQALARGLSISHEIVDRIPCASRVFDQVNPMIVDRRYQHWYRDFLPTGAFADLHNPSTDDLVTAVENAGAEPADPRTTVPPPPARTAAVGSCSWSEARAAIHAYFDGEDNTAAYMIIGAKLVPPSEPLPNAPDDVGVEVQWPVHDTAESADSAVLERLNHVAGALACLSPAIDSLEAFIVDATGRATVYAVVPGSIIRAKILPLPPRSVRLYHVTPSGSLR